MDCPIIVLFRPSSSFFLLIIIAFIVGSSILQLNYIFLDNTGLLIRHLFSHIGIKTFLIVLLWGNYSFAQKRQEKTGKKEETKLVDLEDISSVEGSILTSTLPYFYGINSKKRLNSKKIHKHLLKLDRDKTQEKLFMTLKQYAQNYNVSNFRENIYWIWRLAQMYETRGQLKQAKDWYRIALKHGKTSFNVSRILRHYDSLTVNDKDYYVSLEYYYDLVDYRKSIDTLKAPRSVLTNMGSNINSAKADYAPMLSPDDNYLIFTSKRKDVNKDEKRTFNEDEKRTFNEDLYISQRFGMGNYGEASNFSAVNTEYNEGSACFSSDGRFLIFSRCFSPDGYGHCDLYQAKKTDDSEWGDITNLGEAVNSSEWDSHPTLSHSGDTLFFSSSREENSFGAEDIFYSVRISEDEWGPAENAGPVINTNGREISPFIHHEHKILYFSSDSHLVNFGSFDIYKSYKINEDRQNHAFAWSEPLNIGPLVNGEGHEYYFTIDASSNDLFYAKSNENNKEDLDLFSFPLPMEAQPTATTKVSGSLKDDEDKPFEGIVSIIDMDKGIEITPKFLRPDGSFSFDLIDKRNYLIVLQGDEFFRIEKLFKLDGNKTLDLTTKRISRTIEFKDLEFDSDSANLKDEMLFDLDKIIDFLYDNPNFRLTVSGHTDSVGDPDDNLKLSQERANAIIEYLEVHGGIEPGRLQAKGFGNTKPLVEEKTEEDRAINRRVEFELTQLTATEEQEIEEEADENEDW